MSHANQIKAQYQYNKKNIIYLCGIKEDDYANFQMGTCIEWVEKYWSSVINTDELLNTRLFWQWFISIWGEADDRFILEQLYGAPKASRWCLYRQLHQYMFDDNDRHNILMQKDFRSLQKQFKKQMQKPELYAEPLYMRRDTYCAPTAHNEIIKYK